MSTDGIQERLSRTFDAMFGVDDVMRGVPEALPPPVSESAGASMEGGEVERMVQAAVRPPATTSPPLDLIRAHRSRRRRRIAAGLGLCALLAAGAAQWQWGRTHSRTTLDYEKAFAVLFDDRYDAENRRSAEGKLFIVMQNAVGALKAVDTGSDLRGPSYRALAMIAKLIDEPIAADLTVVQRLPALEEITAEVTAGNATPVTIERLTALVHAGIWALQTMRARGPKVSRYAEIFLGRLAREVAR